MEGGKRGYAAVAVVDISKNLCELHGFLVRSGEDKVEEEKCTWDGQNPAYR